MRSPIVLLPCLALALAGCDRQSPPAPQPEQRTERPRAELAGRLDISARGTLAPDLVFQSPEGDPARLSDFAGKPLLVNLWATWCVPCVKEMPTLDALAARGEGKLTVLTIAQDIRGREVVDPWFAKNRFAKLEPWLDAPNALSQHYATGMLPTTILYDAEGREVWRMIGGLDWNGPRANTLLAEVLAE